MIDNEERRAIAKALAKTMKEFVAEQLNPLLQRLEALERHSETVADRLDAAEINARRRRVH